ncbi:hypothetical protein [Paraburkholderia pallida]|uniref:Uncharacterized protein n=1 Tax=Paraburkholderia pallida TaxID=2547399 RepID=A0A4P7CUY8_9BURK|nr:hypothetical protein [Paraburkholderia pallida]QBQ97911.1 hypothetical protein E1956_12470 [Paraburkholderia pallida]
MFDKVEFKRELLYGEVWLEPMSAVATRHKITVEALRKICKSLAIPLPPLGYWAKVRAGKRVRRALLRSYAGPATIVHEVRVEPEEAARREAAARIRTEQWSASTRAQVEARKERLRNQAEFFEKADKWLELLRRLQYLDHIESAARDAGLSAPELVRVSEWIASTRAVCLAADPTGSRIKAIIATGVRTEN